MYLNSIAFSDREGLQQIEAAIRCDADQVKANALKKDGFHHFIKCESDIVELSRQAIERIAASHPDQFQNTDAVIYVTDSTWETSTKSMRGIDSCLPAQSQRNGLMSVLDDFGLNVVPYGLNLSACDNLGRTLCIAHAMLVSNLAKNILIIIGDKTEPGSSRFTLSGSALYSDYVGAFLVSLEKPDGPSYRMNNFAYATECAVSKIKLGVGLKKLMHTKKLIFNLKDSFIRSDASNEKSLCQYSKVIMGHYNSDFIETMCILLDVEEVNVVTEYSREYSHCYAIDPLIALQRMILDKKILQNERVLQLTCAAEMATLCGFEFCQ